MSDDAMGCCLKKVSMTSEKMCGGDDDDAWLQCVSIRGGFPMANGEVPIDFLSLLQLPLYDYF